MDVECLTFVYDKTNYVQSAQKEMIINAKRNCINSAYQRKSLYQLLGIYL